MHKHAPASSAFPLTGEVAVRAGRAKDLFRLFDLFGLK